eukprot:1330195-Pyramimonas_sp.AAC.1
MFEIGSGALQGCLLSGSIWVLAFDAPVGHLVQIQNTLPGSKKLGACADDLGLALARLGAPLSSIPRFGPLLLSQDSDYISRRQRLCPYGPPFHLPRTPSPSASLYF